MKPEQVLTVLELPTRRGRAVMHWFTGSPAEARRAVELGCYFSVNAAMLTNEKHREMIKAIPLAGSNAGGRG